MMWKYQIMANIHMYILCCFHFSKKMGPKNRSFHSFFREGEDDAGASYNEEYEGQNGQNFEVLKMRNLWLSHEEDGKLSRMKFRTLQSESG